MYVIAVFWLDDTSRTAKLFKEVNRKCRPRNKTAQLSTSYTYLERHNTHTHRHRQTDRRTDTT